jgi:hypothetical protein
MMDNAFRHGDLDGTKSRDFTTKVSAIKVKLNVPEEDNVLEELGYILLKPKYRTTLTTVDSRDGIPNFKFIYNSADPRIEDLMNYELKSKNVSVKILVDNFRQVSSEYLIDALVLLNTHLMNRFTRYDRALILSLALRQSALYKHLSYNIKSKSLVAVKEAMDILSDDKNPLHDLTVELKATSCDYYGLMYQAFTLIKSTDAHALEESSEQERIKKEHLHAQIALQGVENFLRPVSRWNYISQMFTQNSIILETNGKVLNLSELQNSYSRENNVTAYGCYINLRDKMQSISVQDYLIHPNYSNHVKYDYMALSVNREHEIDTVFYKFSSSNSLKIEKMLIDKKNQFIMKRRLQDVVKVKQTQSCPHQIIRLF